MAGANNAQMKAQGFSQRQIEKKRASVKGPLTLDAMRRNPAAGWQAAARGEGGEARRAAVAQRDAFVKASQARAKRAAMAQQGARDLGSTMMASRKAKAAQEAAGKAKRGELTGRGLRDVSAAMMAKRKAAAKPDPHAETRARIASLEEQLSTGKAVNKIIRAEQKKGGNWQERAVARLTKETRATDKQAQALVKPDFAGRYGVPNYEFTNKGATIRRLKDQIGMERTRGKKWEERTIRGIGSFGPGAVILR